VSYNVKQYSSFDIQWVNIKKGRNNICFCLSLKILNCYANITFQFLSCCDAFKFVQYYSVFSVITHSNVPLPDLLLQSGV